MFRGSDSEERIDAPLNSIKFLAIDFERIKYASLIFSFFNVIHHSEKLPLFAGSPNFCNSVPLERNGLIRLNELRYWLAFIIPYENMGKERKLAPLMIVFRRN